jgi:ribosomal protein S18 acetylase RimI-like enzyme
MIKPQLRGMTADDLPFVFELIDSQHWYWRKEEVYSLVLNNPAFCRIAYIDSRPAGILTVRASGKTAFIVHLIVLPEYRTTGLGSILMKEGLNCLDTAAYTAVELYAVENIYNYYLRFGFETIERIFVYEENPDFPIPSNPDAAGTLKLLPPGTEPDGRSWGFDRSRLLGFSMMEAPLFNAAVMNNGFISANMCTTTADLGPWFSSDTSPAALETVLLAASGLLKDKAKSISTSEFNRNANELCTKYKMKQVETLYRMVRSKEKTERYPAELVSIGRF